VVEAIDIRSFAGNQTENDDVVNAIMKVYDNRDKLNSI
jgi:hypothetical protein